MTGSVRGTSAGRWLGLALGLLALTGCSRGPELSPLSGRVVSPTGAALAGVTVTARDEERAFGVSVLTDASGRYFFPGIYAGTYSLSAHGVGVERSIREEIEVPGRRVDFVLQPAADIGEQLPASYYDALIEWPDAAARANFARACAHCHQIGDHSWREPRAPADWQSIHARMSLRAGPPLHARTGSLVIPTLVRTFGARAPVPRFERPPPASGDALRAIVWEFEVDPIDRPSCRDLEIGLDGRVFTNEGYALDPITLERRRYGVPEGGNAIERDADGKMWIGVVGSNELVEVDPDGGAIRRLPLPLIGRNQGVDPRTLRFDSEQRLWYTLSESNHVGLFDPDGENFAYYRLPAGSEDPAETSRVPFAYGCDVAPDRSVWWSQLLGPRIGRINPETGGIRSWITPVSGPRRLRVGPDGTVWVPFYGEAQLGRFDPSSETWKLYPLPTRPAGTELPYAVAVQPGTGHVWITGSNSDSLIRFQPDTERFDIFPLPTPVSWTREIEFDDDGNVWTCTSNAAIAPDRPGTGRIVKLELPRRRTR